MMLVLLVLVTADERDLFPLKTGAKWVYDAAGQELTATVEGTAKVGEKDCLVVKKEWPGGSSKEYYRVDDKGAFLCRIDADRTTEFPENPVPRLRFGLKKGDTWEWKHDGQQGKYEHQGEEEVEVPAGKFKCVKVHVAATSGEMKYGVTRWFAPGVGVVKEVMTRDGQDRVTQLKKFETPK